MRAKKRNYKDFKRKNGALFQITEKGGTLDWRDIKKLSSGKEVI